MGYKMPIVCKSVVLPITKGDNLTLDEYKEKYGIDLSDYIILDEYFIVFKFPEMVEFKLAILSSNHGSFPCVGGITEVSEMEYDSEVQDATLTLIYSDSQHNYGWGIQFVIDENGAFSIENLKVKNYEL